jgi:hypothetical protein
VDGDDHDYEVEYVCRITQVGFTPDAETFSYDAHSGFHGVYRAEAVRENLHHVVQACLC